MHVSEGELREFIIDSGLVARKEIDDAAEEAARRGQSLGDILVARGALTDEALRRVHAYVLGIPIVDLRNERLSFETLALVPEPVARTRNIVAFRKGDDSLEVAVLDIKDVSAVDAVRAKTGLRILPRLTDLASMKHALLAYQKFLRAEFGDIISAEAAKLKTAPAERSPEMLKKTAEDLPIVRIVDTLLRHAIVQGASDIHIEPLAAGVLVRYRIDGALRDALTLPLSAAAGILARLKVLSNLKLDERGAPQDGRFTMETEADTVSFRVSLLPTLSGEKAVLRLLRELGEGFTLDTLGFHGEGLELLHRALRQTAGLILVAGPAGSGKTTTLYTMLDIVNAQRVNISTIEDPVEYRMPRIHQTQVQLPAGLTFAAGLRALLRQDSDIIMVGDIRDEETASLAVNAALSGRLVLAAIAADSASDALVRLVEFGADPFSVASAARVVVGQRLVRRLCASKEPYRLGRAERAENGGEAAFSAAFRALKEERLLPAATILDAVPFYRAVASAECEDGYKSRVGIYEVMPVSPALGAVITGLGTDAAIEEEAAREGMLTLFEDGLYKAARGTTSIEEVVRVLGA